MQFSGIVFDGSGERFEQVRALFHLFISLHHQIISGNGSEIFGVDLDRFEGTDKFRIDDVLKRTAKNGRIFGRQPPHVVLGPRPVVKTLKDLFIHDSPVHQLTGHHRVDTVGLHGAVMAV